MARASSSRNDQLDALTAHRARLMPEWLPGPAGSPGRGAGAPAAAPTRGSRAAAGSCPTPVCPARKPERRQPPQRPRAEQVALVGGEPALRQQPPGQRARRQPAREQPRARAHQDDLLPRHQRVRQRDAVDVLEVAAHRQPARQPGDPHALAREQLLDVGGGHLALHGGIGGEDDLAHAAVPHPGHQMLQPERLGPDAVERREPAAQHVVAAAEIGGPVHHLHRGGLLHDAEQRRVAPRVLADGAGLLLREVAALVARPHALAHRDQRGREPPRLFGGLLEQMKGEALSRLAADPRKPGELRDQRVDGAHRQPATNGSEGTFRISACSRSAARRCASATAAVTRSPRNSASCPAKTAGIDHDRSHRATAVGHDAHHAAARRGLDGATGELGLELLQPALHLLAELKELLEICHAIG